MGPSVLIFIALGVGMIVYALFSVFSADSPKDVAKPQKAKPLESEENSYAQRKMQQQQRRLIELEDSLSQLQTVYEKEKIEFQETKAKQENYLSEIKRREEWVAKAEAELSKVNAENLLLKDKFMSKEKELQEEFAKRVKLSQEKDELKMILSQKEATAKLKEEEGQIQYYQLQNQLKEKGEHLAIIAEFKRKEKINQWVTKEEFDKLNEEYTQIEKELEALQEKNKKLSEEIAHLRLELKKNLSANIAGQPLEIKSLPAVENHQEITEINPDIVKENLPVEIEIKPQEIKENSVIDPEDKPLL